MAEVETLSAWWRRSAIVTIVLCFCVLGWLTKLTYPGAPPIPERVVGPAGYCSPTPILPPGSRSSSAMA